MSRRRGTTSGKVVTVDLPVEMVEQIKMEGERYERSISYMMQWAWRVAKNDVRKLKGQENGDG